VLGRDLAAQSADLLKIADASETRALDRLAALAAEQVPGCAGADTAAWRQGDLIAAAASHPDLARLSEIQQLSGSGPMVAALEASGPVHCPDTLAEERWPEYAAAALRLGVRCCVAIAHRTSDGAVTLVLSAARPHALDPARLPVAELLVALGGAMLGNASQYGESQRTALQLVDAAQSRELVDQAKGMLMHALGCSADEALKRLRQMSQQHNVKVTEVAERIIESNGTGEF
jgi:ANTAR domain